MTERADHDAACGLSARGFQRRARMRCELLEELARARAARVRLRRGAAAASAAAAVVLAFGLAISRPARPHGTSMAVPVVATSANALDRWSVATDPGALVRASVPFRGLRGPTVTVVDDERLVQTLAAIGRPAGIVRADGRAWTTRRVTDLPGGG